VNKLATCDKAKVRHRQGIKSVLICYHSGDYTQIKGCVAAAFVLMIGIFPGFL
jgi:hypothetical protein